MKAAVIPQTDLYVDKSLSPSMPSFIEYNIDPDLCQCVLIIQKYFTLMNKKLTVGIGNMTMVVSDNGQMSALVISVLLSFKNESAKPYMKIIDHLNEQFKKYNCIVEIDKTLDTYLLVKNQRYFEGTDPKKMIHEKNANLANLEIGSALMDLW